MRELRATNIRLVWDAIRPGIEAALQKGGGDWRPEDVYADCVAGEAHLYCAETGAFFVLVMRRNEFLAQKECWVWVGFSPLGESLDPYPPQVARIAREAGAKRLRFESSRPGWEKVPGWALVSSTYVQEL